jgi:uncharacterized protein YndB with AHSA1/START domain
VEAQRIVFTFAWGDAERTTGPVTVVTVTFEACDGQTKVTLHQAGLGTESSVRGHEDGWSQQLDRLAAYVAALSP